MILDLLLRILFGEMFAWTTGLLVVETLAGWPDELSRSEAWHHAKAAVFVSLPWMLSVPWWGLGIPPEPSALYWILGVGGVALVALLGWRL